MHQAAQIILLYCMLAPSRQTWAQQAALILHTTLQQIFITHSHSPIGWNRILLHFAITDMLFFKGASRNPFALHQQPAAKEMSIPFILIIHPSVRSPGAVFHLAIEQCGPRPDLHCTWVMPASERAWIIMYSRFRFPSHPAAIAPSFSPPRTINLQPLNAN